MLRSLAITLFAGTLFSVSSSAATPGQPACHNGSYRSSTNDLLVITGATRLRYFLLDGRTGFLRPGEGDTWLTVPGFIPDAEATGNARLGACDAEKITFSPDGGTPQLYTRVPLDVTDTTFDSGGTQLTGRLIAPRKSHYTVTVLVHGSEAAGAINAYNWQDRLPAQGVGVFVYDKRGTGASGGTYTQDFDVLAKDVVAGVAEARRLAGESAYGVGLLGGSQGGWIAPLAATRTRVDFVGVLFGLAVAPIEEDGSQVRYALKSKGYGEYVQMQAQELTDATAQLILSGFTHGYENLAALKARYRGQPWYSLITGKETADNDELGEYTGKILQRDEAYLRAHGKAEFDNLNVPWTYPARRTVAELPTPQLWILAKEDSEAPSANTYRWLNNLRMSGKHIDLAMFPNTEHGIMEFETLPDGSRRPTKYAAGFFARPGTWINSVSPAAAGETAHASDDSIDDSGT